MSSASQKLLERTPPGTRLCYLVANRVYVLGEPGDDHNCDAMGCGSLDHVIEILEVVRVR